MHTVIWEYSRLSAAGDWELYTVSVIGNDSSWRVLEGLARAQEFSWALTGEKTAATLAKYL